MWIKVHKKECLPRYNYLQRDSVEYYQEYVWTNTYSHVDFARCDWQKGLWETSISVPAVVYDGNLDKAIAVRNRIRDKIFEYYSELNR